MYPRFQPIWQEHQQQVGAFVVGLLVGVFGGLFLLLGDFNLVSWLGDRFGSDVPTDTGQRELVLEESLPLTLSIPAINLSTTFGEPLGLDAKGEIAIPKIYEAVGWYKNGPTPGERGPAVILGHTDSYEGPAVFYNLRHLKVGEEIFIKREDGKTAVFVVTELLEPNQDTFPTDLIYSDLDYAGLRLITCIGSFDKVDQRYSHNLVVFAELLRTE